MLRPIYVALLCLICALTFAACGGGNDPSDTIIPDKDSTAQSTNGNESEGVNSSLCRKQDQINPKKVQLGVKLYGQHLTNWCWVASGQMVLGYIGTCEKQCVIAEKHSRSPLCCEKELTDQNSGGCNLAGNLGYLRDEYGIRYTKAAEGRNKSFLTFEDLKFEFTEKRPAIAGRKLRATNGNGHLAVAIGFCQDCEREVNGIIHSGPGDLVFVNDPYPNPGDFKVMPYARYKGEDEEDDNWIFEVDYYEIQKINP